MLKPRSSRKLSENLVFRTNWHSLLFSGSIIFLLLGVVAAATFQLVTVSDLQSAASRIQPGDSRAKVHSLLGIPNLSYGLAGQSAGKRVIIEGDMYGGSLNSMHQELDSFVRRTFRPDASSWYVRRFSLHFRGWPVLVEYSPEGHVTCVYENGTSLSKANLQRTKR